MCGCGRRISSWIGLIAEVHGCDETAHHGKHVKNLAVGKNIPLKALDDLVDPDASLAFVFIGHCKGFDMGSNSLHCRVNTCESHLSRQPCPPSEALGQLTFCVMRANAPSISGRLNAEYACSMVTVMFE